jgi:F-type H+-transporting ATPase subunit delta
MITGSIARRYARALFSLAVEADRIEPWSSAFAVLRSTFLESAELRDALTNPIYTADQRRGVVTRLAQALALDPDPTNLMLLLAERNRLALLDAVAQEFGELADQKLGRVRARVVSAVPLEEAEATRLAERLAGAAKAQVIVDRQVDPTILGGVVARVGSMVYDGSLRSQLEELGRALKR